MCSLFKLFTYDLAFLSRMLLFHLLFKRKKWNSSPFSKTLCRWTFIENNSVLRQEWVGTNCLKAKIIWWCRPDLSATMWGRQSKYFWVHRKKKQNKTSILKIKHTCPSLGILPWYFQDKMHHTLHRRWLGYIHNANVDSSSVVFTFSLLEKPSALPPPPKKKVTNFYCGSSLISRVRMGRRACWWHCSRMIGDCSSSTCSLQSM